MGTQSYFKGQYNNSTLRPVQKCHDLSLNTLSVIWSLHLYIHIASSLHSFSSHKLFLHDFSCQPNDNSNTLNYELTNIPLIASVDHVKWVLKKFSSVRSKPICKTSFLSLPSTAITWTPNPVKSSCMMSITSFFWGVSEMEGKNYSQNVI